MKSKTLFFLFIATVIFSSCTTTLQQRRVADELYDDPVIQNQEQVRYSARSVDPYAKDTLFRKDSNRYLYNHDFDPKYYGYKPYGWYHRYYPNWYYWDFYPYYNPYFGMSYPWYHSWYSPFFGFSYYGYYPFYSYSPYYTRYYGYHYPRSTNIRQRKMSSGVIYKDRDDHILSPHSQRIRKVQADDKNLNNPSLRLPANRSTFVPKRTVRALDRKNVSPNTRVGTNTRPRYVRPSNSQQGGSNRKYKTIFQNLRTGNSGDRSIQKRSPAFRSPNHSGNRTQNIRPSPTINRSSNRSRK